MNKTFVVVVIVILALGGFLYWYSNQSPPYSSPASYQSSETAAPAPSPAQPEPASTSTTSATTIVTYTDKGFSPSTVTIPKGGTVTFKNAASDGVWVGSNPHPIHNGYPTTGGCLGSTFDSCKKIPPGGSWSFTFTFAGHWGYHNHLNPSEGGTVIVQ